MNSCRFAILCVVALVPGAACTDLESATNLNPEGPPMIRQVRMKEMYLDASGNLNERATPIFAFGTHPQVTSDELAHPVTSAKSIGNKLRIIMDELLVGNYLEEIQCRGQVDDDAYDTVPVGTTPDDIARCAVAKDVLASSCPAGEHAVCICKLDGGCGETPKGGAVGVNDVNQDGTADDTRFIRGAVGLQCGSVDVPIDIDATYWNPSGDQNVPALGGFDALGPAVVLTPAVPMGAMTGTPQFLPTNTTCSLVFASNIVDKQNINVCAPPNGDITGNCTPGDVSAFSFKVEPLGINSGLSNLHEGDTGVSRTQTAEIVMSAPVSPATLASITVREGATPFTGFTVTLPFANTLRFTWTGATGLAANTMYTITLGTGLQDLYNQPIPMPQNITFTTGS